MLKLMNNNATADVLNTGAISYNQLFQLSTSAANQRPHVTCHMCYNTSLISNLHDHARISRLYSMYSLHSLLFSFVL